MWAGVLRAGQRWPKRTSSCRSGGCDLAPKHCPASVRMFVIHPAMCSRAAWVPSLVAKARPCVCLSFLIRDIHTHTHYHGAGIIAPACTRDPSWTPLSRQRMVSSKALGLPGISWTPGKLRHPTPLHGVSESFPRGSHTCLRLSLQTAISPVPQDLLTPGLELSILLPQQCWGDRICRTLPG